MNDNLVWKTSMLNMYSLQKTVNHLSGKIPGQDENTYVVLRSINAYGQYFTGASLESAETSGYFSSGLQH